MCKRDIKISSNFFLVKFYWDSKSFYLRQRYLREIREVRGEKKRADVAIRRRCTPQLPPQSQRVEAIKKGLSETVVYVVEVDYNQTVVHKTTRQRYYCHLNGLAPTRAKRRVLPRTEDTRRDLEIKCSRSFRYYLG